MKIRKSLTGVIIQISILFFIIQPANSQWKFSLSYDQEYNDNPFRLPEAEKSLISNFKLGTEKNFNKISLGYYGNYSHFNNILDRNFYWHQLAVFGGSDTTNWGIYGEQRINKREYNIFDYKELNAFLRHRFFFKGIITNWSGGLQYNNYDQLAELNNWKLSSSLRFHKTFPTKTTIITGLNIDHKNYLNSSQLYEMAPDSSISKLNLASTSILNVTGNGKGHGGSNGGGKGYRYGEENGYLSPNSYVDFGNPSVTQLSFSLRVAQSLNQTTGFAIQYFSRFLLSGEDKYISDISYNYNQESEIFNDPMGYESHSFGSELTKLLPADIILKLSAYYVIKDYSAQGIYIDEENYDSGTLRQDKYKTVFLNLKKNIGLNIFGGNDLALSFNYLWIDNNSNSYWYDYTNNYGSVRLEFQF